MAKKKQFIKLTTLINDEQCTAKDSFRGITIYKPDRFKDGDEHIYLVDSNNDEIIMSIGSEGLMGDASRLTWEFYNEE